MFLFNYFNKSIRINTYLEYTFLYLPTQLFIPKIIFKNKENILPEG